MGSAVAAMMSESSRKGAERAGRFHGVVLKVEEWKHARTRKNLDETCPADVETQGHGWSYWKMQQRPRGSAARTAGHSDGGDDGLGMS